MTVILDTNIGTVQKGIETIVNSGKEVFTISQNMRERLKHTSVLPHKLYDKTDVWDNYLDSRSMVVYGRKNKDKRFRFKIDHDFNLKKIIGKDVRTDGAIDIRPYDFNNSKGTEFIIIKRDEIDGAGSDYAIRKDKYDRLVKTHTDFKNHSEMLSVQDLCNAGGCRINTDLMTGGIIQLEGITGDPESEPIFVHDIWFALAAGINNYSKLVYDTEIIRLLADYISLAGKRGCFKSAREHFYGIGDKGCDASIYDAKGMGVEIGDEFDDYKVQSLCLSSPTNRSDAGIKYFDFDGRFLRVLDKSRSR